MIKKTAKRLWLGISSILTCLCLVLGIIALSPMANASAAIDGSLGNSVTLNKIQATNGITAEGTTNQYVSFDMGTKGGNVWIMTQFTGKNAPNYSMNAKTNGSGAWTASDTSYNGMNEGTLITNSSEYNAEYLQVFQTTNTSKSDRANLGNGKNAGLKNFADDKEYIQIIGYENAGTSDARAKITYYLFEITEDGSLTLVGSVVPTDANCAGYSFRTDGQYVVLYGNIGCSGLDNDPDSVTFQYAKPATTLTNMMKGISDYYEYKDDIVTALDIQEDVSEEVEKIETPTLQNNATLNKIQATNGITATGTTNQYVSFDMGTKGDNVWIMTQFTGKNAPNYAMNAKVGGSGTWTAEYTNYNTNEAGVLLTNSSEYNAEYLQVFNTTNTASGKARANLGSGKDAGLKNFVDGKEYIQIIGYENSGDNSTAKITYYLFTVTDGVATLSKSIVPTAGNGNTYSFRTDGQYVVLYGNIQSTGLTSNSDSVTFQYTEPAATLTGMLKGVSDQYAYKDDIVATLGFSEEDVKEEVEIIEDTSLENTASLNKIQATNGITAEGTANQYVSFDMGEKGGNVWIMTQFTGKNAPNYAMNAAANGLETWDSANASNARHNAGVLLTNSSEYNAEYLQVFNTTNTASGKARANLGSGKDAGLKNFVDGKEYIQIIGYENFGDGSTAKITYYLFEISGGAATLAKSIVPTVGNSGALSFSPYGQYVVLYGNIECSGLDSDPDGVTFSFQAPKTTLSELINSLASDYAYKDDIATVLNITIDTTEPTSGSVTFKDMADNTLKTLTNVDAVKLPNSTLADFVGWYNEADGKLYKPGDILPVERDMSLVEFASGIALEDGAAVRLKNDASGIGGLRFEAVISKTVFDLLGDNIVFTGAIIPTDLLTGELTLETVDVRTRELVNKEEIEDTYHAYITLTAIKQVNFNREYSARAFVTVTYADGTTATFASAYSEENNSRSVYYVAAKAYSSGEYGEHSVLKYYLDNAVSVAFNINKGLYEVITDHEYDGLSATFTRGYTVSNLVIDGTTVTFDVTLADETYNGNVSVKFWSNANTSETKIVSFVNGTASVSFVCEDAIPNYTDGEFTYWAYSATCGDYYQINSTKYYQDANGNQLAYTDGGTNSGNVLTATDADSVQLYADAGFNVMFINWGATAYGATAGDYKTYFDKSVAKTIMNYAWEHNIKCFIYSTNLHRLSKSETSLIVGEGNGDDVNTFDTQADLVAYVEKMLYGVKDHPAFYGVSLVDEPSFKQFDAIGEIYQAVQSVAPGAFCNINLHPMNYDYAAMKAYNQESYDKYNGKTGNVSSYTELETAYKEYINLYYEKIGQYCGYIQYDSYPMLTNLSGEFYSTHISNAQIVAEFCEEKGMRFGHVYQTYKDVSTLNLSGRRGVDADDIEWQLNFGMAMGVKDHSYYTYYPVLNADKLPNEDYTFVDRAGNPNDTYYTVQKLHSDMAVTAKALAHFEYRGMKYIPKGGVDANMQEAWELIDNTHKFDSKMTGVSLAVNGVVLTTELYDEEAGRYGYFVMNATNPYGTVATQTVTLSFSNYKNVQIYQDGKVNTYPLTNGQIQLTLAEAAGAFVIPY